MLAPSLPFIRSNLAKEYNTQYPDSKGNQERDQGKANNIRANPEDLFI
jgi:hypothetical protein